MRQSAGGAKVRLARGGRLGHGAARIRGPKAQGYGPGWGAPLGALSLLAEAYAALLSRAAAKRGLPGRSGTTVGRGRLFAGRRGAHLASHLQPFANPKQPLSRTSGGLPSRSFSRTTSGENILH